MSKFFFYSVGFGLGIVIGVGIGWWLREHSWQEGERPDEQE